MSDEGEEAADVCSKELAPFLKPFNLYQFLGDHIAEKRLFLRRNLTYYAPEHSARYQAAEAGHILTVHLRALQLAAAYRQGLAVYVAACHSLLLNGTQVLVPLTARAVLLGPAGSPGAALVQLPVSLPEDYGGSLDGLALLLLHAPGPQGPSQEQRLLEAMGGSWSGRLAARGGKSISCDLTRCAGAFSWPAPGSAVLGFSVELGDPQQQEAAVELLQAAFQVHPPAKGKLPCHSLSLSRQQLSDDVRLEYQVEVAARYALGTANGSTAAPPANGFAPAAAAAAAAAAGRGDGGGAAPTNGRALPQWQQQQQQQPVGQQHLQNGRYQRHGEQPARLAGLKRKLETLDHGPPPQEAQEEERAVWISLYGLNGLLLTQQQARGSACFVCGLRCRSFTALRQHLLASHSYFDFAFSEDGPQVEPEIAVRCRRELYSREGEFLPALELLGSQDNLQGARPWQQDLFVWACPPHQRAARWGPSFAPRLRQVRLPGRPAAGTQEAGSHASQLATSEGQYSGPGRGGSTAEVVGSQHSGVEEDERELEREGEVVGSLRAQTGAAGGRGAARAAAPCAVPKPRKPKGRPKQARQPEMRERKGKEGLALLTPNGRLKFYHSRTCVPMTQQELLADDDSDDDTDETEWKRACLRRLYEAGGRSESAQHDFMFLWDWHLQRNPLYCDGDVPLALAQFRHQHAAGGGPAFHRCFAAMVTNLWRYRLLTPDQAYELLRLQGEPAAGGAAAAGPAQPREQGRQQEQQQEQQQQQQAGEEEGMLVE